MLKDEQLEQALAYRRVAGSERVTGHFDHGAKASVGPTRVSRDRQSNKAPATSGVGKLRFKLDETTGALVAYFVD